VRRLLATDSGFDLQVWDGLSRDLGLTALGIPEAYGGSGFGMAELIVVMEEMGRSLLCAPFYSSAVLATQVLLAADDEAARCELLPGISAGSTRATLAFTGEDGQWTPESAGLRARRECGQWLLDGARSFVVDGASAQLILVSAQSPEGLSLFAVQGDTKGLQRRALATLDQTRKLAALEFSGVAGRLVGSPGSAAPALRTALDLATIALAAEQVGGAQRCLDMSTEYAKVRYQFGRPIGSFQAIKHKCANMLVAVESARSALCYAAWAATRQKAELPVAASLAKAAASDACFLCAAENIQVHGGIGFTWDFDAQLYFKRAKSSQLMLGDAIHHRARFADLLAM
jgi:alkylation response protein AidB-like acyl-CoA dehydrogenase